MTAFDADRGSGSSGIVHFLHGLDADAVDDDGLRGILDVDGGPWLARSLRKDEIC
ncbi:hypothetical protein D3C73_567820 [compost metagenome]